MFVATVSIKFHSPAGETPGVADALMEIEGVITTRVTPGGGWVIYRVDVAVDLPEDAVEPSLAPARAVAERLGLEIVGGSADVEVEDTGVPFTGRAVALHTDL